MRLRISVLCSALAAPSLGLAQPLEVRVAPAERVYLHQVHRGAAIHDFVVQNVAVINRGPGRLTLERVRFEVLRSDQLVYAQYMPTDVLEPLWRFLRGYLDRPGMLTSQRSVFLLDSLLTGGTTLAATLQLEPGTAMLIPRRPFVSSMVIPDRLRIVATARNETGGEIEAQAQLALVRHASPNEYVFPVTGRWFVASSGSLHSHHRWRPASEFALDLTRVGEGGRSFRGEGTRPGDYYAYGAPVLAVAAGRVVSVHTNAPDNELPKPTESREVFAERVLRPL